MTELFSVGDRVSVRVRADLPWKIGTVSGRSFDALHVTTSVATLSIPRRYIARYVRPMHVVATVPGGATC